jgi:ComF family protein
MVDNWLRGFARLLLPPRCLLCGGAGDAGQDLCAGCRADLPLNHSACARCALPLPSPAPLCGRCLKHPPPWSAAAAPLVYADPVDRLLLRYKFAGQLPAGALLAELMAAGLERHRACAAVDLVVPVPLHASRLAERGYNQAWELARQVARSLERPADPRVLERTRATTAQAGLTATARRRNVRDAFRARPAVRGLRVALVDDVVTTGATVRAATLALRAAGAVDVVVWAVARAPRSRAR